MTAKLKNLLTLALAAGLLYGFLIWGVLYSEIMAYLHGKRMRAVLEDDPGYYYEGRFAVNEWKSEANWSSIVIDYEVEPYKKSLTTEGEQSL